MPLENHELVDIIRKRREGFDSLSLFADSLKLSPSYISDVLNGNRSVGKTLAEKMGYIRVKTPHITFKKKAR